DQLALARMPREAIVGKPLFDLLPDRPGTPAQSGATALRESLRKVCNTGVRDDIAELRCGIGAPDHSNGHSLWRSVNTPVLDSEGKPAYILHSMEDLSRGQTPEQALRH